jgi:hypothetical protein
MLRMYSLLVLVAGCGFQIGVGGQTEPPGDAVRLDDGAAVDALPTSVDAMVDAMPDAMPCADDDNDDVCNSVDTWPCGPAPQMPASPITLDEIFQGDHLTVTLSNTQLGTGTRLITVAPNATFTVTAGYSIFDCICPNCIDQIQIGLVPGTRKVCMYDGNPNGGSQSTCMTPTTGNATRTLTAPAAPGVYEVRFRVGQDDDCDGASNNQLGWWTNVPPGPLQTVALVCVR